MNSCFMELKENEQLDINGGIGILTVIVVAVIVFVVCAVATALILFNT